jgi:hypothetical protein
MRAFVSQKDEFATVYQLTVPNLSTIPFQSLNVATLDIPLGVILISDLRSATFVILL